MTFERWSSRFIALPREVKSLTNQLSTRGASRLLRTALLFRKTFHTFTDLLKHQFQPLEFF